MLNKQKRQIRKVADEGFTLVELMVVVAIIGILAAVAIPNYQKYQARARQSEAKVALAAAYTAMQAFYTEQGTFTGCLLQAGYDPRGLGGNNNKRYYTTGFNTVPNNACGPAAGTGDCLAFAFDGSGAPTPTGLCTSPNDVRFDATFGVNSIQTGTNALADANMTVSKSAFLIGAGGSIAAGIGTVDTWTVDQNKVIVNTISGL